MMADDKDESPYIKLVSAEGCDIFLSRRIALQVETLRVMLEGNFRESEEGVIRFPDISASALEKVVKYLHYKDRYSNSSSRIPEFVIDPEEVRRFLASSFMYIVFSLEFELACLLNSPNGELTTNVLLICLEIISQSLELLVAASYLNC